MWSWHYCLLVFIAVLGVLQLAAISNDLRGLFFFPRKAYTVGFGIIAIGFAIISFFTWNESNSVTVEGSQQTGSFVVSAAAGIIFTVVFSSLLNLRRFNPGNSQESGLNALRDSTFFQAMRKLWGGKGQ